MYFSLFNLNPAFDIDISNLESEYFKAQRLFHPDRFIGKSAEEKIQALQKSADINKAYDVLKNPLKRAQHLLELQGIIVGTDKDSVKPANELLMEVMELRESNISKDEVLRLVEESQNLVANHYKNSKFSDMAQEVLRLGYLMKMLEDAK
ncbi:MAG: Fe-S protein assembly co-chaperone HscB [Rickettsiales bacterium]